MLLKIMDVLLRIFTSVWTVWMLYALISDIKDDMRRDKKEVMHHGK